MNFWFKNSKIKVDAFVVNPALHKLFPVDYANSFIPDWWKATPGAMTIPGRTEGIQVQRSTIKKCPGFFKLYNLGFIIPLWSDIIIKTTEDGKCMYDFSVDMMKPDILPAEFHNPKQLNNNFKDYIHFKFASPWFFKEKTGVKFLFTQPSWSIHENIKNIHVLPGIVDFQTQNASNINAFLPKADNQFMLDAGTPILHIVPISEKEVELNTHLVSEEEWLNIGKKNSYHFGFKNSNSKKVKILNGEPL